MRLKNDDINKKYDLNKSINITKIHKQNIAKNNGHFVHMLLIVTSWGKFGLIFCKQTSVAACRFQSECNKVEIALRDVQFWSEIKLVITNRSQTKLYSTQCNYHYLLHSF